MQWRRWQQIKARIASITSGPVNIKRCADVLDPLFFGRWTIVEVDLPTNKIGILGRGAGYPLLDPMFAPADARKDLESCADTGFRDWITSGFVSVAKTRRAKFDDVDAVVMWPRFGDLRTRYWRILVPLSGTSETCQLLAASGNDSGIDLRPQHIQEMG